MKTRIDALAYPAATGTGALLTFLTIPLVVKAAGAGNFGIWTLLESAAVLLAQFVVAGVNFVAIERIGKNKQALRSIRPLLMRLLPVGVVTVGLLLGGLAAYGIYPAGLVPTLLAWILGEGLLLVGQSCLRGLERPRAWALAVLTRQGTVLGWFLLVPALGASPLEHLALRFAVGAWLAASISAIATARASTLSSPLSTSDVLPVDWRSAVGYSLPLLASSLLGLAATQVDKWWLLGTWSPEVLGQYSLHQKVASVLGPLVTSPIALWWPPFVFRNSSSESTEGAKTLRRSLHLVLAAYTVSASGLLLGGPLILGWLAPGIAMDTTLLALMLSICIAQGLTGIMAFGQLITPRPWGIPLVNGAGLCLQVAVLACLPSPAAPTIIATATGSVALGMMMMQAWLSNRSWAGVVKATTWLGLLPWGVGLSSLVIFGASPLIAGTSALALGTVWGLRHVMGDRLRPR